MKVYIPTTRDENHKVTNYAIFDMTFDFVDPSVIINLSGYDYAGEVPPDGIPEDLRNLLWCRAMETYMLDQRAIPIDKSVGFYLFMDKYDDGDGNLSDQFWFAGMLQTALFIGSSPYFDAELTPEEVELANKYFSGELPED